MICVEKFVESIFGLVIDVEVSVLMIVHVVIVEDKFILLSVFIVVVILSLTLYYYLLDILFRSLHILPSPLFQFISASWLGLNSLMVSCSSASGFLPDGWKGDISCLLLVSLDYVAVCQLFFST